MARGRPKTGGRQKGTPNKVTATLRDFITALIDANRAQIKRDLKTLPPKDRLTILERLMAYVLPKQQTTTINANIDDLIRQIEENE